MDIGNAIQALKRGEKIARAGWNGKKQYIYLLTFVSLEPCIAIVTEEGKTQPGWLASQADMLARDWFIWGKTYDKA